MPFQAFTEGVPNPPNFPAVDVNTMLQNNNSINRILSNPLFPNLDNIGFNDADGGFHHQVSMDKQAAPGLQGMQGVLYTDEFGGGATDAWPIWQNALGTMAICGSRLAATFNPAANGYTSIPGGIILQWGTITPLSATRSNALVFAPAFPTNCWQVIATLQNNISPPAVNSNVCVNNIDRFGCNLDVFTNNNYAAIRWMAIGN